MGPSHNFLASGRAAALFDELFIVRRMGSHAEDGFFVQLEEKNHRLAERPPSLNLFSDMKFSRTTGIGAAWLSCLLVTKVICAQDSESMLDQSVGYYPTFQESGIISTGDYDYERGQGGGLNGPDLDRWGATGGIWPSEYQDGGLSRLQRFMQPVDYILRPLTPGETLASQGPTSNSWFQIGGSFPFLSRTYHPEKSTMASMFGMESTQNSPIFFDVLSISAIGVYVDGSGPSFEDGTMEDGFLSALSVGLRAGWGVTDRTSLILAGEFYFVLSPDSDFQFYADAGALGALASLNLQFELGGWDVRFFDDLVPFSSRDLLRSETYQGEGVQQVGHYYVGIPDFVESGNWWDSNQNYIINTAGFTAGTFVGESLRFLTGFGRVDTWLMNDFDDHSEHEYLSAGLFYDGYELWVAPSITYTMMTHDFKDPIQTLMLNLVAPISPNVTAFGGVGYNWGDVYDGYNWNVGIQNNLTNRLTHSIAYSSGYHDAIVGDDFVGNRATYQIGYQIGARIHLSGLAGWYEGGAGSPDATSIGASADFALGNYTFLQIGGAYYDTDGDLAGPELSGTSWMYTISLSRRLAERLNGQLAYEYVDSGIGLYQESAIIVRLTRTF